ncbi:piggyBac transposable element-derived protein 4-like [Astyanax mexicanus]|uniref:piggyBac transposable element-derived protein 4-like n=1 Tax=Astyanax mexicanus TaxID=7994 RepID=UPI0020CB37CC|nr:piggyBac transposable element-derived protein 4-like [Astyanax mexicanus]XP_049337256.1 piggyBac transposable element-derived protein 4-like [Astyanax mexicanus]
MFMHLAAFTAKDKRAVWLRGHFIESREGERPAGKMKRHFSTEEALEMVMQPLSTTELQESSEEDTSFDAESNTEWSLESSISESASDPSSESEEDIEDPAHLNSEWTAKNGQVWSPSHSKTLRYIQAPSGMIAGPTRYAITRIHDVASSFDLFFTPDMIQLILQMTNLHGRRSVSGWSDVDETEIRAYMGLLILAGVYRSKGESTRSLWDDQNGRPVFRATMSHKRFQLISASLRFDDRLTRPCRHKEDKLSAFRNMWDKWVQRLPLLFNPGENICVDEQLVPFRGRCKFRQYMPSKPAKYGLKIWVTTDVATSYAWRCQVYTGKPAGGAPEMGQGKRVILDMTEGLKGVTVTCDNFFTSYSLAQELLRKKVALVGTIRANKPELPPRLKQTKGRAVFSSLFAFTNTTAAVSYIPRRGRNVLLLSTKHREPAVHQDEKQKPQIIIDYNHCKGGVDNLDKVVSTYSCRRRTSRWPLVLFFNCIDISAFNAFVLFTAVVPSWNQQRTYRRRLFLEELGKSMVSSEIVRRRHPPRTAAAAAMVVDLQAPVAAHTETTDTAIGTTATRKRGVCWLCTGLKKRSSTTCIKCNRCICREHQVTCCRACWSA